MKPLARNKQLEVITNVITYLRHEATKANKPVYLQIDGLTLTPELEADLECVGLAGYQINDGCLITWSEQIESAKNCYAAEEEYESLKSGGPESCEETEGD